MLNVDDICTLSLDWGDTDLNGKRVQIIGTQVNGSNLFYRVLWRCRDAFGMKEKYGNVFAECELKKISK
jgi:hypothetical protein